MLAKSKLSSIKTLVSQTLIDLEISHEEFVTISKERDIRKNERNTGEKMRLNSVDSKK